MTMNRKDTSFHLLAAMTTITVVGVAGIVALAIMQPGTETIAIIGLVTAFIVPTLAALYAGLKGTEAIAEVQELKIQVDGRLTQLLAEREEKGIAQAGQARAEGNLEGQAAAMSTIRSQQDDQK